MAALTQGRSAILTDARGASKVALALLPISIRGAEIRKERFDRIYLIHTMPTYSSCESC